MQVMDESWLTAATLSAAGIAAKLAAQPLAQSVWHAVKTLSAVFVVVLILEIVTGGNLRRYLTRNFRTDVTYGIFYAGGIYNSLVYAPLVAAATLITPAWNFRTSPPRGRTFPQDHSWTSLNCDADFLPSA